MNLQYGVYAIFLQEFLQLYEALWKMLRQVEEDHGWKAVCPPHGGPHGLLTTVLKIFGELGSPCWLCDLVEDIRVRELVSGVSSSKGRTRVNRSYDYAKAKPDVAKVETVSELFEERLFKATELYKKSQDHHRQERPTHGLTQWSIVRQDQVEDQEAQDRHTVCFGHWCGS
jgi:hypothetical protein